MPLSPTQRSQIISQIQSEIGSPQGGADVKFRYSGRGFSAAIGAWRWFDGLPELWQFMILKFIAERQYKVGTGGTTIWTHPKLAAMDLGYNVVTWEQNVLLPLSTNSFSSLSIRHAMGTVAEAIFNPDEASHWWRKMPNGSWDTANHIGLYSYDKTSQWTTAGNYNGLHNFLKNLLPEIFCDVANALEPQPPAVPTEYLLTQGADAFVVAFGVFGNAGQYVMVDKTDTTQDFASVFNTKMGTTTDRQGIFSALYNASNKSKATVTKLTSAGTNQVNQFIYSEKRWVTGTPSPDQYFKSYLQNWLTESNAITIVNGAP